MIADPPPPLIVQGAEARADRTDADGIRLLTIVPREPCATATSTEIIICGRSGDSPYRYRATLDPPGVNEELSDSLRATLGPLEIGSLKQLDGTRKLGVRLRF